MNVVQSLSNYNTWFIFRNTGQEVVIKIKENKIHSNMSLRCAEITYIKKHILKKPKQCV